MPRSSLARWSCSTGLSRDDRDTASSVDGIARRPRGAREEDPDEGPSGGGRRVTRRRRPGTGAGRVDFDLASPRHSRHNDSSDPSLRCLPLVGWRSAAGREVECATVRGSTDQRRRIDFVVGEPALPVPGYEDGTFASGDRDVAIWHPSLGRRRGWWRRYPGQRAGRRAAKTLEHRTPRCGAARRCHQRARNGLRRGDGEDDDRVQQHCPQPHDGISPFAVRLSYSVPARSTFSLTPLGRRHAPGDSPMLMFRR
jgi:hypothetical protein